MLRREAITGSTNMAAWLSRSFLYPFINSLEREKTIIKQPTLRALTKMLPQGVSTGKPLAVLRLETVMFYGPMTSSTVTLSPSPALCGPQGGSPSSNAAPREEGADLAGPASCCFSPGHQMHCPQADHGPRQAAAGERREICSDPSGPTLLP